MTVTPPPYACTFCELERIERELSALRERLARWFELADSPCLPDGTWPAFEAFHSIDHELREQVGAPPNPHITDLF